MEKVINYLTGFFGGLMAVMMSILPVTILWYVLTGGDVWGMDVSRFGDWTTPGYTLTKVIENYSRRFKISFPNEELPAGRPLHTSPIFNKLTEANAVWGSAYGLEYPLWFQETGKTPIEEVTFKRSNAFPAVAEEVRGVRDNVGLMEITGFAKHEFSGTGPTDL